MIHIERNPSRRQLTAFGLTWLVFFGLLGGISWWKSGSLAEAVVLWGIGVAVPAVGHVFPGFLRLVFLGMSYATFPVGFVLSYIILAVVYYLVLTPIGLVVRLMGKDPMQRRFDHTAKTYWTTRESKEPSEQYFKQF
jgi:hypothetical protein